MSWLSTSEYELLQPNDDDNETLVKITTLKFQCGRQHGRRSDARQQRGEQLRIGDLGRTGPVQHPLSDRHHVLAARHADRRAKTGLVDVQGGRVELDHRSRRCWFEIRLITIE